MNFLFPYVHIVREYKEVFIKRSTFLSLTEMEHILKKLINLIKLEPYCTFLSVEENIKLFPVSNAT